MSGRDANQLAADVEAWVREKVNPVGTPQSRHDTNVRGRAALDELVALVGTLQQERDDLRRLCSGYASDVDLYADELYKAGWHDPAVIHRPRKHPDTARAEAAEAALAETQAQVAALTQANEAHLRHAEMARDTDLAWKARAEAAEAALAWKDAALTNMTGWHNEAQAALAEAKENYERTIYLKDRALAAMSVERPTLDEAVLNVTYWKDKAVAAEAALAEARETVANLCTRPGTCLADTGGDTAEEGT